MYSNPLGPTAATGIGAVSAYSFSSSLWFALAAFTILGAVFALLRLLPTRARKRYREAAFAAQGVNVTRRSWRRMGS